MFGVELLLRINMLEGVVISEENKLIVDHVVPLKCLKDCTLAYSSKSIPSSFHSLPFHFS
jgi:hypothetical protein